MNQEIKERLIEWACKYNSREFFEEDPIVFPRRFADNGSSLQDIEVAAVFAAHFAWGRRAMIVRDTTRLLDEMEWRPYDYVMNGVYRDDDRSIHRTVKWSEVAAICGRLREFYLESSMDLADSGPWCLSSEASVAAMSLRESAEPTPPSPTVPPLPGRGRHVPQGHSCGSPLAKTLESLSPSMMRVMIYGQKEDPRAANKKINMMRRWMVRDDGKVDLGVWKHTDKRSLIIPLDVHVYRQAADLGLTSRKPKDIVTAMEITDAFREIFPNDPCLGDFALFGYGVNNQ